MTAPATSIAELLEWKKLVDAAGFDNEPLYVTEEEWTEIRERFGTDSKMMPLHSVFGGKRVVIDAAKALEQRRHEILQDLLDVLRRDPWP